MKDILRILTKNNGNIKSLVAESYNKTVGF